jgi:hypothetical protein
LDIEGRDLRRSPPTALSDQRSQLSAAPRVEPNDIDGLGQRRQIEALGAHPDVRHG